MMTALRDNNVLITGAASGIGRLTAQLVAQRGAKVILWDVDKNALEKVIDDLHAQGLRATAYHCDLARRDDIKRLAQQVLAEHGPVTVLINNAGVVTGKALLEEEDVEIIRTFEINTLALFWVTRAFLPAMLEQGEGHVVTLSSASGLAGAPHLIDYGASKFAAFGFDEALRLEMKHLGLPIKTTVVCPFYISTGMFAGVRTRFPWILPILKPDYVARRIVTAIIRNRARLLMPRFVYVVWLVRVLPVSVFDALTRFFGINASMDRYSGRKG